jgi:ferredoxin-NADP reductase
MATRMSDRNTRRTPKYTQSVRQQLEVAAIEELAPGIRRYTLKPTAGHDLIPFEAGCSLPVHLDYADKTVEYAYAISSSPRDACNNTYQIVVKRDAGGYASSHILDTWAEGDRIEAGMPM